jgi:hypothetical protein
MPNVSSSLGTTQPYIPLVNGAEIGKAAGLHMHFATLTALNTAITAERSNISASSPTWTDGQPITVAGEGAAVRRWSVSGQHARNVTLPDGSALLLASDSTAASVPVGGSPVSSCTYDSTTGNLTGYTKNGVAYTFTYKTVNSLVVPDTKVGGGKTVTYSYNGSGQLTGEVVS